VPALSLAPFACGAAQPPLAFIGNFALSELALIVCVALLIFGGRLPEVAMRAAAQVMRARKVVTRMWREAGLEQELRRVQWDIERNMPRDSDYEVRKPSFDRANPPRPPVGTVSIAPAQKALEDAQDAEDGAQSGAASSAATPGTLSPGSLSPGSLSPGSLSPETQPPDVAPETPSHEPPARHREE